MLLNGAQDRLVHGEEDVLSVLLRPLDTSSVPPGLPGGAYLKAPRSLLDLSLEDRVLVKVDLDVPSAAIGVDPTLVVVPHAYHRQHERAAQVDEDVVMAATCERGQPDMHVIAGPVHPVD
eukprot:713520-Hanusia_phi.AAC.2